MRFQLIVGDAPILNSEIGRQLPCPVLLGEMRPQGQHIRKKTPGCSIPVFARSADARAGQEGAVLANGNRGAAGRVAVIAL